MDVTGGEAFPFATLERLMNMLESSALLQFAEDAEIDTSLESWLEMLLFISDCLEDAEGRQLTERRVKRWLSKLRDLVYDAEDIVDVLNTEMLKTSGSDSDVVTGMSSEMEKITEGLKDLKERIKELDLKPPTKTKTNESIKDERITTALLDDDIVGRDKDKKEILNLLPLSPETTSHKPPSSGATITGIGGPKKPAFPLCIESAAVSTLANDAAHKLIVIPIWGMGGIGKTTLAQLVYNDDRVKKCFNPRIWLCVSDTFDVLRLTKTILKTVDEDVRLDDRDLSNLQEKLKEKLVGKKFMIVLDDVWSKDCHEWESLCKPLRAAGTASTIIVTCRNEDVALKMGTVSPYSLQKLSEEHCLCLIAQKALKANDFSARPALEPIGKEIARKCQGSPLAAKTLGGLLEKKSSPDEWRVVLQSKIWDLPEDESKILPALRLSYHHLPSSLKQCFAYLAIFPKDSGFERDALVLLWMAEGFLEQRENRLQMEDLGQQYFDDLVSRSLLQQSTNDPSIFVMHDLTHDLAEFVAREICFRVEDGQPGNKTRKVFEKVRHSAYAPQPWQDIQNFDPLLGKKYLRTFLALYSCYGGNSITVKLLDNLSQFRRLRVLGLNHDLLDKLPDSVGGMKHLRYLNLSLTHIRYLPKSVNDLHNLQSLILENCSELLELPRGMTSLTNLRHLSLLKCHSFMRFPDGGMPKTIKRLLISQCEKLEALPAGIMIDTCPLEHLEISGCPSFIRFPDGAMPKTIKRLLISQCKKLEALPTGIMTDTCLLEHLEISGCPSFIRFPDGDMPKTIKRLLISYCKNLKVLPDGIMNNNVGLEELKLDTCESLRHFPQGELPISLKSLHIKDVGEPDSISERKMITSNNICLEVLCLVNYRYLKALPECTLINLTSLDIWCCNGLESFWEGGFSAPKLKRLFLGYCYNLRCITDQIQRLTSLETLSIEGCSALERFPEAGFPTSLLSLKIWNCQNVKQPISKWGLHKLTSLREFEIEGVCLDMVCFGDDSVLPSSLTSLVIKSFPKLVSLSSSLQNLISLRHLCLGSCPNLQSFPKELLALLPQLSSLRIDYCPHLRRLFEKEKGEYWPHISLIPDIKLEF